MREQEKSKQQTVQLRGAKIGETQMVINYSNVAPCGHNLIMEINQTPFPFGYALVSHDGTFICPCDKERFFYHSPTDISQFKGTLVLNGDPLSSWEEALTAFEKYPVNNERVYGSEESLDSDVSVFRSTPIGNIIHETVIRNGEFVVVRHLTDRRNSR